MNTLSPNTTNMNLTDTQTNLGNVGYEVLDGVATLTINRPDKLNALNRATIAELHHHLGIAVASPEVKAVIVTGAGPKAFAAGADIAEFANYDARTASEMSAQGHNSFDAFSTCPKPTLAAINGFALGGGLELAMACHMRIASENAKFGQPEVNLGTIPGYGGTQRLKNLIGLSRAAHLLFTGEMINAAEALRLGLVSHVYPQTELSVQAQKLMSEIGTKAPIALAYISELLGKETPEGYLLEIKRFGESFETADFKEGTAAFLEKRPAQFTGK